MNADAMFRVYWNNNVFSQPENDPDTVCCELLISDMALNRSPNLCGNRWTSPRLQGIFDPLTYSIDLCRKNDLRLQISNEIEDVVRPSIPTNANDWMERYITRILSQDGFTDYFFELAQNHDCPRSVPDADTTEYPVVICGPAHQIVSDMHCRPLSFCYGQLGGEGYCQENAYGGLINNYKWVPVSDILGDCWIDKGISISEYLQGDGTPLEFIKGTLPVWSKSTKSALIGSR